MADRHAAAMRPISFHRHRFDPATIRVAVWLCCRFTVPLSDVAAMLAVRRGASVLSV